MILGGYYDHMRSGSGHSLQRDLRCVNFLKYDDQVVKPIIRIFGLSHTVSVVDDLPQAKFNTWRDVQSDMMRYDWQLPSGYHSANLALLDLNGRVVQERGLSQSVGKGNWEIGVLARGLYLYVIRGFQGEVLAKGKVRL